jgi:hypothetical protein
MVHFTEDELLAAIKGSGGIMSTVAKRLNCHWGTALKYIQASEITSKAIEDENESILDLAESVLIKSVREGDMPSVFYYLNNKGKKRGYNTRLEVADKTIVNVNFKDTIKELLNEVNGKTE